jgi:hypothetical protein
MFLNPYKDYLHQAGEENVKNPNTLDTDKASKAFRCLIMIQFGITNISFLVLYPDGSYKFSPELGANGKANPYTNHLFVLVLQSGHFTALSIDESVQNRLYCVLLEEDKKDHTKHVCPNPKMKETLEAIYYASTGKKLIGFEGTYDDLLAIIVAERDDNTSSRIEELHSSVRKSAGSSSPKEPTIADIQAMFKSLGV